MQNSLKSFNFKRRFNSNSLTDNYRMKGSNSSDSSCEFSKVTDQINLNCKICNLKTFLSPEWSRTFADEFEEAYFKKIIFLLHSKEKFYPPIEKIFAFSYFFPIARTKVVIIGQDPYHNEGQATGLAFHVPSNVPIPPSLKNIKNEVKRNYESAHCDLVKWAQQGVLLLNDTLTVFESKPNSHSSYGWNIFTEKILKFINSTCQNVVFILWGNYAGKKKTLIDTSKHLVLISTHPSPFSVEKGFNGCEHFKKTNEFLRKNLIDEIDW